MCHMSMRTVTPLLHSAEFQVTTTHIRLSYELQGKLIIRPIPYRVNYSLHFSNFQIVKKLIYKYIYTKNLKLLFIFKKRKKRGNKSPLFITAYFRTKRLLLLDPQNSSSYGVQSKIALCSTHHAFYRVM